MEISTLITELKRIEQEHGDISCQLQSDGTGGFAVCGYEDFFIVPEEYDDGWRVSIRWWPY